jgi:hypothetical protein
VTTEGKEQQVEEMTLAEARQFIDSWSSPGRRVIVAPAAE